MKSGRFRWVDGGTFKTSTCHVANCVEGMMLAAEKGQGGQAYFLTDGEPVVFRDFITSLLKTQGVDPGKQDDPLRASPWAWPRCPSCCGTSCWLPGHPPITRPELLLAGREVTVSDAKARRELGYQGQHVAGGGAAGDGEGES